MAFSERLRYGVMFGGIWETGDAEGDDAAPDGRDRMFNLSAEATYYFIPAKLGSRAWVTREFSVRDRFEGTLFTLGVNYLF